MKTQTFWGVVRSKHLEIQAPTGNPETLWRFRRYDRRIEQSILPSDAQAGTDEWVECDLSELKRLWPDIHQLVTKEFP